MTCFPTHSALSKVTTLFSLLLLAACSSTSNKGGGSGGDEDMGPRMSERMGKTDTSKRSHFEKSLGKGPKNKGFKTTSFHRQSDFQTGSSFSGGDDRFNAKSFGQSDKASSERDKAYSGRNDRSSLADDTYKTGASRLGGREASATGKVSSMNDDVFRTFDNRMGSKGMENSKQPLIMDEEPEYSESQIRSLLNKN